MEKIWVQFNDDDYQIYHNYCLRYYTIQNTTRKRSIHLFLELFEKDILPVDEHDLGEVFLFFSEKCDELQADHNFLGENSSSTNLSQFHVCRDMLFLIEDFEKLYLLIQKAEIDSNYLLVMATFTKIFEEENNVCISAINELDRKKTESFAPIITETIRTRVGPDAGWEAALYELTRIVRRFNLASPYQKIDWDCSLLIGVAVASHFNADIEYEMIRSTLERFFKEYELDEFESYLNQTPVSPDDTDSDVNDYVIFEAMKSISCRDVDPAYTETTLDPGLISIAKNPPLISQSVTSPNTEVVSPSGQIFMPHRNRVQKKYSSRFDIDVNDTVKSLVVFPKARDNPTFQRSAMPGIPPYSLLVVVFTIFLLYAFTTGAASGNWSPIPSLANNSTGIIWNLSHQANIQANLSTPVSIQKTLSQPVGTPKNLSPGVSIQKNSSSVSTKVPGTVAGNNPNIAAPPQVTPTSLTSTDINKHFMRVAFGSGTTIKKNTAPFITTSITGDFDKNTTEILEQFKGEFNNYSSTNQFSMGSKPGEWPTIQLVLLPQSSLNTIEISPDMVISKDPKSGVIYYIHDTVTIGYTSKDVLYINSDFKGAQQAHWMLRGLLSELGFEGETNDYPSSIFYAGSDKTTQLNAIDGDAIQIMYSQKITHGMSFDRVKSLLLI